MGLTTKTKRKAPSRKRAEKRVSRYKPLAGEEFGGDAGMALGGDELDMLFPGSGWGSADGIFRPVVGVCVQRCVRVHGL